MTAGWLLLAGDRRLVTSMQEAGGEPRRGLMRAPGGFWKALRWRREDHEIAPGAMGRPSEVLGGAMGDLSLRFLMFWAIGRSELTFSNVLGPSDALALRLCSEIVQGRVRATPPWWYFIVFGP